MRPWRHEKRADPPMPDNKQEIIDKMRKRFPTATREQCLQWHAEDAAFAAFASRVLDAANAGVDTSFLRTCPDLTALAMRQAGS